MKYYEEQFEVEGYSQKISIPRISGPKVLAMSTVFFKARSDNDIESWDTIYTFCLEHSFIEVGGKLVPIKEKGKEIYWPQNLADDLKFQRAVCSIFLSRVFETVFLDSPKSTE